MSYWQGYISPRARDIESRVATMHHRGFPGAWTHYDPKCFARWKGHGFDLVPTWSRERRVIARRFEEDQSLPVGAPIRTIGLRIRSMDPELTRQEQIVAAEVSPGVFRLGRTLVEYAESGGGEVEVRVDGVRRYWCEIMETPFIGADRNVPWLRLSTLRLPEAA